LAQSPFLIALTGTIGSGKSSVARFLAEEGAVIIDADELAREAVLPGSKPLSLLTGLLGEKVLLNDGALNRKVLADAIFDDADLRQKVEQIIHPEVFRLFEKRIKEVPADSIVVFVVPLLFESGVDLKPFRKIVVVTAGEESAVVRIAERDHCSVDAARKRIKAQLPSSEKEKRADIILRNDGNLKDLHQKAVKLYEELVSCRKNASE